MTGSTTRKVFPTLPAFVHDPANPISAKTWLAQINNLFGLHDLSDGEKVKLCLSSLSQIDFAKVSNALLPEDIDGYEKWDGLKKVIMELFDFKESLFARRYAAFQFTWKGPINESPMEIAARIKQTTSVFDMKNFSENELQTMLLLMSMKDVSLEPYRIQILRLLNKDPKTSFVDCIATLEATFQTHRDQKLPSVAVVQHVKRNTSKPQAQRQMNDYNCENCGRSHPRDACKFKHMTCYTCGKKGHLANMCKQAQPQKKTNDGQRGKKKMVKNVYVNDTRVKINNLCRRHVMLQVDGSNHELQIQIDTGSDITVLNETDFKRIGSPQLEKTQVHAYAANDSMIEIKGSFVKQVSLKAIDRTESCRIYVGTVQTSLFGLDLFNAFELGNCALNDVSCNGIHVESIAPVGVVEDLMTEFEDLFTPGIGKCTQGQVKLQLKKDARLKYVPARRQSSHAAALIKEKVDELVNESMAYKVDFSNSASPGHIVKKKDGKYRLVVDFSTGLNESLDEPGYPLPTPEDIYNELAGSTVFSVIDIPDAYHHLEVDEESRELLTISTSEGLIRSTRMLQGVKTAPSIFQKAMDVTLAGLKCAKAYFDDVIVFSRSVKEHKTHLRRVFRRMRKNGFKLKKKKCKLFMREIKFLGRIVSADGIRPDPEKIIAIQQMSVPVDVPTLRSFLGMINFYQSFIPAFRDIREPLDDLLKKDCEWSWTPTHREAFNNIKKVLTDQCLLTHFDPQLPLVVAADASQNGIGGVISHIYEDGTEKPIYFFSRALNASQRKYTQSEKEGLALVTAVKTFHRYLEGRHFTLLTDHKALLTIFGKVDRTPTLAVNRLHRWALILAAYDFKIEFRGTKDFGQADALSRLIREKQAIPDIFEEEEDICVGQIQQLPVSSEEIREAYTDDEEAQSIMKILEDPGKSKSKNQSDFRFSMVNDMIMMHDRVYIPLRLRPRILTQLHVGHNGIKRTKALARMHVYWKDLAKNIESMIQQCHACIQLTKNPVKTTLASWPATSSPGERIHVDFAGPLLNHMFLVIVDSYSKWIEVAVMKTANSDNTIKVLQKYMADNGISRVLVSDNGTQFSSGKFAAFCAKAGINHMVSPPYHPQSNGQAERMVDTVKRFIKKCVLDSGPNVDMDETVSIFLQSYRSTPTAATPQGSTPAMAHIGREIRTVFGLVRPDIKTFTERNDAMEAQYNHQYGTRKRTFKVDDDVYFRKKPDAEWFSGKVIGRKGTNTYLVHDENGKTHHAHTNQLIKRSNPILFDCPVPNSNELQVPQNPIPAPQRRHSRDANDVIVRRRHPQRSRSPPAQIQVPRRSTRATQKPNRLQVDPSQKTYAERRV